MACDDDVIPLQERIENVADKADLHARVDDLLEQVRISAADADKFPHEFSGGQRQRISIARALAAHPEIAPHDVQALVEEHLPRLVADSYPIENLYSRLLGNVLELAVAKIFVKHALRAFERHRRAVGAALTTELERLREVKTGRPLDIMGNEEIE